MLNKKDIGISFLKQKDKLTLNEIRKFLREQRMKNQNVVKIYEEIETDVKLEGYKLLEESYVAGSNNKIDEVRINIYDFNEYFEESNRGSDKSYA